MDEIRVIQHSFLPNTSSDKKSRRRPANCFFLFRQEMMKERPPKITMTDYSKRVSEMWQNLSEDEKTVWKRKYEINRDFTPNNTDNNNDHANEQTLIAVIKK